MVKINIDTNYMTTIKEEKSTVRKCMLQLLRAQHPDERQHKSEQIRKKVLDLIEVQRIQIVMLYVSDQFEVETHQLINTLLANGKRVVIPYVDSLKNIIPCEINDLDGDTEMSPYGYREPRPDRRVSVSSDELQLIVIPGVAFDRNGNRLGRGWGCYDRFLAGISTHIPRIGIAFDFQVIPSVPVAQTDFLCTDIIAN